MTRRWIVPLHALAGLELATIAVSTLAAIGLVGVLPAALPLAARIVAAVVFGLVLVDQLLDALKRRVTAAVLADSGQEDEPADEEDLR